MKCYLDGDALCITKNNFVDLQESDAEFIKLSDELLEKFKKWEEEE